MPVRKHPPSSSEQLDGQSTSLRRSLPRAVLLLTLLPLLVAGSMALIAGSQRLRLRHGDELQDRAMLQAARLQRDFAEIEALIDAAAPRLGRCASEQPDALCGRHPWLLMSEVTERPADGDTRSRWELAGDGALTLHWPEDNGSRVLLWHFPAQIWAQWWQAQAMSSSEKMVLVQGHRHVALRGGQKVAIQDLAISPAWLASPESLRSVWFSTPTGGLVALADIARDALSQGLMPAMQVAYFGAATLAMRKAMFDANHDDGVQLIGQVQGLIHDQPTVAEVIARTLAQAREVSQGLQGLSA